MDRLKNDTNVIFSIIIPHKNSCNTLDKLLRTIPDRKELQVIVVDDKSSNNEAYNDLKDRFSGHLNIYFYSNYYENVGAGTCRNIGLSHAKGKWIIFADADDFFTENAFDYFMEYVNSDADIIYFGTTSIDLNTGRRSNRHDRNSNLLHNYLKYKDEEADLLIRYYWGEPWGKMIRADLIMANDINFDEIIVSNDIMFSIKAARYARKIDGCKGIVYVITKSSKSLTQMNSIERSIIRLDTEIKSVDYLRENLSKQQMKKVGNCGIYSLVVGYRMYGWKYTKGVIRKFRNNNIPLFRFRIIRVYWIQYKNRILSPIFDRLFLMKKKQL